MTVGTAFAGSWFFEFTKTNDNGKRSLTKWGRRAIVFAALSLVLALVSTVWTDRHTFEKQREANEKLKAEQDRSERDRSRTLEYQQRAENSQNELKELLNVVSNNIDNFDTDSQQEVGKYIDNLDNIDDYKRQYPDLYNKLIGARSYPKLVEIINEALERKMGERVSADIQNCSDIELDRVSAGNPIRLNGFKLADNTLFNVYVDIDGLKLGLVAKDGLEDGYKFVLDDGDTVNMLCNLSKSQMAVKIGC